MTQNRYFVTTASVALFAAGADAACSVSLNADGGVPNNRISAAMSSERSFEHREPPPRHLVAFRRCKDPELERPVAG